MIGTFITDLACIAPPTGADTFAFTGAGGERIGFVQIISRSPYEATIHRIWALQVHRGHGSAMLSAVCELADRRGIILKLKALPFGNRPFPMSSAELVDWYGRHGFDGTRRMMRREPKSLVESSLAT